MSAVELVVIGAGITGLAAAWEASADPNIRVTVIDAGEHVGGKILSSPMDVLGAQPIDEGADAFLARVPQAIDLCNELGLADQLVEPAASRAKVYLGTSTRFLPSDTVLGVPVEFDPLEASGLVSPEGMAVARAETEGDWHAPTDDVSIGAFLTERYGREVVDHVVAPLIGGINAGNVDRLSLRAVTPGLAAAAAEGVSLTLALRRARDTAPPPRLPGVFRGLKGGTETLVKALHTQLVDRGVAFVTGASVESVSRSGNGLRVTAATGATLDADAVVVTSPASQSARILKQLSTDASEMLASIEYSSVALLTIVLPRSAFSNFDPQTSGVLIPRNAGKTTTAISIGSNKWPHWVTGDQSAVVLRVSVGHSDDHDAASMDEQSLTSRVLAEVTEIMGINGQPSTVRVSRWLNGFAQYGVGHLDLVDDIERALGEASPVLRIAGASYRGLGIPACIEQGRQAARELRSVAGSTL